MMEASARRLPPKDVVCSGAEASVDYQYSTRADFYLEPAFRPALPKLVEQTTPHTCSEVHKCGIVCFTAAYLQALT